MLKIKNLSAGYGKLHIVNNVSLDVKKGSFVALIGPNGSGKSTLLKSIVGLTTKYSGKIYFMNEDVTNKKTYKHIQKGLAFVPQIKNIFSKLTVKENLEIAGYTLDKNTFDKNLLHIFNLFPLIKKEYNKLASHLSGGQRQILAIAMAYINEPKLLLLDEPTAGLSLKNIDIIFKAINKIYNDGVSIMIVEHNVKKLLEYATDIVILKDGKIVENSKVESVDKNLIQDIYFS